MEILKDGQEICIKEYMRNGCLLIGEKTAILYKIHHSSILFNNKFKKISHDNNVIISQKINEVQIIIKS